MTAPADFALKLRAIAERIKSQKEHIRTEEATKHAVVLPVLQALGYDVFNPAEVVPEFCADFGIKKGEKVDYAIMRDGKPVLLIECKPSHASLADVHSSQLYRYFSVTPARLALLTNGSVYAFHTDLDAANVMDPKPFLEVDLSNMDESSVEELYRIAHAGFDVPSVVEAAFELKYTKALKKALDEEFAAPSPDFVKLFVARIYEGRLTAATVERFTPFITQAVTRSISERINARLRSAFVSDGVPLPEVVPGAVMVAVQAPPDVVTTEDELMAFYAVKAILAGTVDVKRVKYRDAKTYCSILLDDNNRKPICRLWFNGKTKTLGLIDETKKEERVRIDDIDDIYGLADRLRATVARLEAGPPAGAPVENVPQGEA